MSSQIREVVKNICCSNGWSYGVFWGVNRRNSMLLTVEEVYFEEKVRMVMDNMLQQVHTLGEGIIGEAAFTGKHQWMHSDTSYQYWGPTGSVNNQDVFQDISEFHRQFSSGIKTIALITVAPLGVVQFGSTEKILERLDFINHIRRLFQQLGSVDGRLTRYAPTTSNREVCDLSSAFDSVYPASSCPNYTIGNNFNDGHGKELMENMQSPMIVPRSSALNSGLQSGKVIPLMSSSYHLQNQIPAVTGEDELIISMQNMQSPQVLSQFSRSSAINNPTWRGEETGWTIFDQQMLSGMGMEESPNTVTSVSYTPLTCGNKILNFPGETSLSSTYGINRVPNAVDITELPSGYNLGLSSTYGINQLPTIVDNTALPSAYSSRKDVDDQVSAPLFLETESELPKGSTSLQMFVSEGSSTCNTIDFHPNTAYNMSHWIAQSVGQCKNDVAARVQDNPSQAHGHETLHSVDNVNDGHNSLANTVNSLKDVCHEKMTQTMQLSADTDLFDNLGLDFEQSHRMECWDDYMLPVVSGSHSSLSTGASECISDFDVGSSSVPQQATFTDFRLEQLLEGVISNTSDVRPSSEDQFSTTTTTTTTTTTSMIVGSEVKHNNEVNLASHSRFGGSETKDPSFSECRVKKTNMQKIQEETERKAQGSSWTDDSYSINMESAASTHPRKPTENTKATRKKGQSRETNRPRPKDRQQIQDRVKELREIVPNGGKCSIDALLDRTIKHMLFLQSVTKYADKLKQVDEPKIIGDENGVVLKDNLNGGGATWAFEVGGQTMVCPIIVEDLSPPGQMLIEMLCEERGYFLEIADTIRGFGLIILKGVMEIQDDKIWARFIVEANRNITRMDIFLSLVQLLQQTAKSGINSKNQLSKSTDGGAPARTNYHQSPITPPGLADPLQ